MGPLLLFITTFIWGTAFLAQKIGGEAFGPFTVTCLRSVLGGCFLLACIGVRKLAGHGGCRAASHAIFAGAICGVPLFAAIVAQQIGIQYTTPGISAFLTTNYILFVPLVAAFLTRRLPRRGTLVCALVAFAGTYFICITPGARGLLSIGRGEAWTILCALLFAFQMLAVDRYAKECDVLVMSAAQLFTCAAIAAPFMLLPSEANPLADGTLRFGDAFALVYLGIFSSGIAYTLQNFGQARTSAALAAVICSMESVFGALSGWVVFGDTLTPRQFIGCALVFGAALVGSLPRATRAES